MIVNGVGASVLQYYRNSCVLQHENRQRGKRIPLVLAHVIFLLQLHKLQVGLRQKSEEKRSQALESEVMKEEMEQYIGLESPALCCCVAYYPKCSSIACRNSILN